MRLLLVEDDTMIGRAMRQGLADAGFSVDWVMEGHAAGRRELRAGEPGDEDGADARRVGRGGRGKRPEIEHRPARG